MWQKLWLDGFWQALAVDLCLTIWVSSILSHFIWNKTTSISWDVIFYRVTGQFLVLTGHDHCFIKLDRINQIYNCQCLFKIAVWFQMVKVSDNSHGQD